MSRETSEIATHTNSVSHLLLFAFRFRTESAASLDQYSHAALHADMSQDRREEEEASKKKRDRKEEQLISHHENCNSKQDRNGKDVS